VSLTPAANEKNLQSEKFNYFFETSLTLVVSTTPAVPVAKFAAGVVDTRGKFAAGDMPPV
jgi:hypothetical protein